MSALPGLVTRSEWQAARPKCREAQDPSRVRYLVVHYSAMDADERDRHSECAGRVRGIQRYHMTSDQLAPGGACDIGYSWLVCRHGSIFRGRGWGTLPAATAGANSYTVAVCFLGNDTAGRRDATPAAREAIRALRDFCERHGSHFEGVAGHRDFNQTTCPGAELYAFVARLNAER